MALRRMTVRFGERAWEAIREEADAEGISAAQLVRESTLESLAHRRSQRGESVAEVEALLREILAEMRGLDLPRE